MQMNSIDTTSMHARARFDAIVALLEEAAGQKLNGPIRALHFAEFEAYPDGFERCARKALKRGHTNPIGLLVKMVRDGEHRRHARSAAAGAPAKPLVRALAWAGGDGRMLEPQHQEDILGTFGLDEDERAQVRASISRSLGTAATSSGPGAADGVGS
jgi:hypothetical protein